MFQDLTAAVATPAFTSSAAVVGPSVNDKSLQPSAASTYTAIILNVMNTIITTL